MIVLFTDFGLEGPYMGQMKAAMLREAPGISQVDLMADAPAFDARASAYLLAATALAFPSESVFLAVVDPGVGSDRGALVVAADGRRFVGPDNGLLAVVAGQAQSASAWRVTWTPERLSASFHGRDLFAPVAARLALGEPPPGEAVAVDQLVGADWPEDLAEIVYLDRFGNAMTGLRASSLPADAVLSAGGQKLRRAGTFSDVAPGSAFWYENANGLAEIAANQARAEQLLGLKVGDRVELARDETRNDDA